MRLKTATVGLLLTIGYAVRASASTEEEEDDNNFREDVVVCEEAVAHASACCGFRVQGDACRFYHYSFHDDCGCDTTGTDGSRKDDVRPVVSGREARRIANLDCESMKPAECARIESLLERDNERHSSTTRNCR